MYQLDKIDLEIIRNLWNGRTPYRDVAEKVGLTTNTVRNRVNNMLKNGALQIISLVNPKAIKGHSSAIIGIKVQPQHTKEVLDQISRIKGIVAAATVSGRFDIMAVAMFNEEYTYLKFMEEGLRRVKNILSTETFFVIEGDTWQLRYVL